MKNFPGTVIISAGMQRAGTLWYYNLTHDLWVAAGGQDARQIRERYHLEKILRQGHCSLARLAAIDLFRAVRPAFGSNSYVLKTHAGPTWPALILFHLGWLKPTYIYRDPRDAALSAHEFGQRVLREKGRPNAFSGLDTIEKALDWIVGICEIWQQWMEVPGVLVTRYEDLLTDYDAQVGRLGGYLGLDLGQATLMKEVAEKYRPGRAADGKVKTHYYRGQIGRFRQTFTPEQKEYALALLGAYIDRMGYPRA